MNRSTATWTTPAGERRQGRGLFKILHDLQVIITSMQISMHSMHYIGTFRQSRKKDRNKDKTLNDWVGKYHVQME